MLITLFVKLALLPFSQTVNADAVSRIYTSLNWMENPGLIRTSIWAPFHFYIHGTSLMIWNNIIYTPKIVTVLFSVLTLFPFYFLTKREFNKNGALIATIFLAISPILFRNSFMALSEIPYLFFLAMSINLLSKGIRQSSVLYILLAGVVITVASGIRYEAWVMIVILTLIIFLLKRWKFLFLFNITALIFPIYWLVSNWLETGNPLYSINGTYHWALEVMNNNDNLNLKTNLRRLWFFPFSWVIAIGIPVGFIILKTIGKGYSKKNRNEMLILYSLPFFIMLLFFLYNTFKGILLTQHRYVGTLVILSLPIIAIYFSSLSKKKVKHAIAFGLLTISLSFIYNTSGIIPVPRLEDQSSVKISEIIKKNTDESSCLILDFIGWDNTYFVALQSQLPQENIIITEGATNSKIPKEIIHIKLEKFNKGVVLFKKNSELFEHLYPTQFKIDNHQIKFKELYNSDQIILIYWEK